MPDKDTRIKDQEEAQDWKIGRVGRSEEQSMYLIRLNALKKKYGSGRMTENEKFAAYVVFCILSFISISVNMYFTNMMDRFVLLLSILLSALIYVAGIFYCYRTNKKGDHINFIERMVIASAPAYIQAILISFLYALIAGIVIGLLSAYRGGDYTVPGNLLEVLYIVIFYLYYFIRVNGFIKYASTRATSS